MKYVHKCFFFFFFLTQVLDLVAKCVLYFFLIRPLSNKVLEIYA